MQAIWPQIHITVQRPRIYPYILKYSSTENLDCFRATQTLLFLEERISEEEADSHPPISQMIHLITGGQKEIEAEHQPVQRKAWRPRRVGTSQELQCGWTRLLWAGQEMGRNLGMKGTGIGT